MKKAILTAAVLACVGVGCTKIYRVAKPTAPVLFKQKYSAGANEIYYALRWALKTYGYPIAEEDFQNGVIKTRYVSVRAHSHYIEVFGRKDYGVSGAYHQLEVRLQPQGSGGQTEVQIGSRVQAVVSNLKSNGSEEKMILAKISDYLRSPTVPVTNLGVQE